MRVSLKWLKKYVELPVDLTPKQIAYDLTLRTVEVEDVEDVKEKFNNIVVGKILEVKQHPNADKLKVCIVDIGEREPVQIVCGGSNLYEGEQTKEGLLKMRLFPTSSLFEIFQPSLPSTQWRTGRFFPS